MSRTAMGIYKCLVRVKGPSGKLMMAVWVRLHADNPFAAKRLFELQYGAGNVVGVPVLQP